MKKYNLIVSGLSLLGVITGYGITFPEKIGLCKIQDFGCIMSFPAFTLGQPLFLLSLSILVVSFILYFVRKEVFLAWSKFALWFIPLSIFLIFLAPKRTNDFLNPFDKKMTVTLLSSLFFLTSLVIIIVKASRLEEESPTRPQTPA